MGAHEIIGVFSDAQEISADDTASSNTLDMAVTNPQFGVGHPIFLCIRTAVAPTNTSDTLSIEVQLDTDSSGDPSGSWATVAFMPLVGANGAEVIGTDARLLLAGAWIWRGALPYSISKRHMRLMYRNTTSNGVFTIDAWLEDVPQSDRVQVAISNVGNP